LPLARALRSVLAQTWTRSRASVFDNASGDETEEVVKRLSREGSVSYHRHPSNLGAGPNFLHALAHVDAPFFSILSDDDLLLPRFYEEAMAAFARHPEAGFVCLDVLWANDRGDVRWESAMRECPEGLYAVPDGLRAMARFVPTTWTGVVFRREVVDVIGTLDLEVGTAFDVDFLLRAAARFPFVLRHAPGAVFIPVSIADALSLRGSVEGFWPGWTRMVDRIAEDSLLPQAVRTEAKAVLTERLAHYLGLLGLAALVRGDIAHAAQAAEVLTRDLGYRRRGLTLSLATAAVRLVPGSRAGLRTIFDLRQTSRHLWHRARGGQVLADVVPREVL
jgi:glycosyltransferase involved in cell wall biosynthesis